MKKEFLFFLLMILVQVTYGQVKNKSIIEFKEVASEGFVLIDVRTPEEYAQGFIDGAINMDMKNESFVSNIQQIDKNKKVYLYCKAGGRSAKASKVLDSLGYKNIINLEGGFDAWKEAGNVFVEQ
ncbi:MAG: rhodanese-like domain-containing protein [Galbibacter orientalis]|uniref:rhodanese-like domain-containing protein n=1 Tax=Galbibacter orientalis TaxID=453852 RepID=UPI003001DD0C